MKPSKPRLALAATFALGALAVSLPAHATAYTFTGTTAGTTTWSSGTGWDVVPASGSTTDLVFGTGQTLDSGVNILTTQNIATPFQLNSLTTNYSGSGTEPSVGIQTGALNFVSDGLTTPTISLNSTGASRPQLVFSSAVNFGNNIEIGGASSVRFDGAITNTGGAVVTKSGAGIMRIATDNAGYTGNFNVTGGTLQIGNNGGAGDAGSGTVTLSGGGSFVVRRSSGTLALNNTITGTGNVKFQTRNFTATINKANTYIGSTTLEASSTTSPGGGIKLGIDNGLPVDTGFTINRITNGVPQTFDLNGYNQTLASIATTGSGVDTTNSIITNSGAARTLEISNATGSTTYAGLISGAIALTKSGGSTQILSGANTYTGATTIKGGVLNITGSTAAGSAVAVGGAGATGTPTLSGSGSINGAVTVKSAGGGVVGKLDAGDASASNPAGKLTVNNNLTFESGSIFEWDIKDGATMTESAGDRGVQYDAVDITGGGLSVTASVFRVVLNSGEFDAGTFWDSNRSWASSSIFSTGGSLAGFTTLEWYEGATLKGQSGNLAGRSTDGFFTISGSSLTWTAIPELSNLLIGGLLGAGLLRRRR